LLFYFIPSTTALCETIAAVSVAVNMIFIVIVIILLILLIRSRSVTQKCIEKQNPLDKVSKVEIIKSVEEIFDEFPANNYEVIGPDYPELGQSKEQYKDSRYFEDQQSNREGENDQYYEHILPAQSNTFNLMAQLTQNIIQQQTNTKPQQSSILAKNEEEDIYQDPEEIKVSSSLATISNSKTAGLQNSSRNSRDKQARQIISKPGGNGWQTGQKGSNNNLSKPSYNQSVDTQSFNSFKNDCHFTNSNPSESRLNVDYGIDDTYENPDEVFDNRNNQAPQNWKNVPKNTVNNVSQPTYKQSQQQQANRKCSDDEVYEDINTPSPVFVAQSGAHQKSILKNQQTQQFGNQKPDLKNKPKIAPKIKNFTS
jgi:hypothetical protein